MVFSPSLKTSTNSLFAPAEDDEHQELRGARNKEVSPSRVEADDDDDDDDDSRGCRHRHRVITAPRLANGGGGANSGGDSDGNAAMAIEADGAAVSSSDVLAAIPGATGVSSPSRAAEEKISSPRDKDFVEEVSLKVGTSMHNSGASMWARVGGGGVGGSLRGG